MALLNILIVYIIYLILVFLIAHYVNIFSSKTEYTRDELTDLSPLAETVKRKLEMKYSPFFVIAIMLICSMVGLLFSHIEHWIFQSALIPALLFVILPILRKNIMSQMVIASDSTLDSAANIFAKYCHFIILGYGSGYGTGLMYYWSMTREMLFLWFAVNLVGVTVLLVITAIRIVHES
ncbi:MAG: hypothetical protein N2316_09190 [Spirochaetes bacterium]|nr:hypothetical protein [Spirochaetota bacterium]